MLILPTILPSPSCPQLGGRTADSETAEAAERPAKRVKLEHCTHEEISKLVNPQLGKRMNSQKK